MTVHIKAPASSANIGIGFDALAIAFDIFNAFSFKTSSEDAHQGFQKQYTLSSNLALQAYQAFHKAFGKEYQPVTITLEHEGIPISRGLGSSSSLILAGVLASNILNHMNQSFDQCVTFAANYEGHPDNVFACAYGGFISVLPVQDSFLYHHLNVSKKLHFHHLIPLQKGSTKTLRNALPTHVPRQDAASNIAKMSMLPHAFETGDLKVLKHLLEDKIHEPYRIPLLKNKHMIETLKQDHIVTLSGSGPSLLIISDQVEMKLNDDILASYEYQKTHIKYHQIEVNICA
jgi:homoserine kinase